MALVYKIRGAKILYLLMDGLIAALSFFLSYLVRYYPDYEAGSGLISLPAVGILIFCFSFTLYIAQVYRIVWHYSHSRDFYRVALASLSGVLIFIIIAHGAGLYYSIPHIVLTLLFVLLFTTFIRLVIRDRIFSFSGVKNGSVSRKRRIMIAGAGDAGRLILSEYYRRGLEKNIIGFADDDKEKSGTIINGKKVMGSLDDIIDLTARNGINEIIFAMPSAAIDRINQVIKSIKRIDPGIEVKTLPPITKIFDNLPLIPDLMDSAVADILGREEFSINMDSIEHSLSGKTVLITGAGGSIGSEICKQMLKFRIKKLIALGRGEHSIYGLIKSLNEYADFFEKRPEIVYRVNDVRDYALLEKVFHEHGPDIVFHAAAHKHVPLMEFNEAEALKNNVMGTRNVLELSLRHNVSRFVLVSTDKAVNPVSIMGATKRMAEILSGHYHRAHGLKTAVVRFGNVLGSRGSVVPLFEEQIRKGGPVTITHPDIKRYFMSIAEAALLVINSAALSEGGETFVLDMGTQFRIVDIARQLIRLHGLEPDRDIKIEFTGLRPGEKLYEELYYNKENLLLTSNNKIFMLKDDSGKTEDASLDLLLALAGDGDKKSLIAGIADYNSLQLRQLIKKLVPEYSHENFEEDKNRSHKLVN